MDTSAASDGAQGHLFFSFFFFLRDHPLRDFSLYFIFYEDGNEADDNDDDDDDDTVEIRFGLRLRDRAVFYAFFQISRR